MGLPLASFSVTSTFPVQPQYRQLVPTQAITFFGSGTFSSLILPAGPDRRRVAELLL